MSTPNVSDEVRAQLRAAARQVSRERDEQDGLEPGLRRIQPVDPRHEALFRLLLDAVAVFHAYGLDADPPSEVLAGFRFDREPRAVHVKVPANGDTVVVRGTLRETPAGGGPVRALGIDLCTLDWDPVRQWVPTGEEAIGTALDLLVVRLLQALGLTRR